MVLAAFSLQSEIKSVGAYAGIAAVVGLALLVLLYFSQAREIRRLSDLLEEQANRPQGMPSPMPRPVAVPPGSVLPPPPGAGVTTAVPGVRRVTVGAASGAAAPAAPGGAAAVAPGVVPAATVAGAMAAAPPTPDAEQEAEVPGVAAPRSAPAAGVPPAHVGGPGAATPGGPSAPAADPGAPSPAGEPVAKAAAAVPLVAEPAATAEPVGAAQTPEGTAGDAGPPRAERSPDTSAAAPPGGPAPPGVPRLRAAEAALPSPPGAPSVAAVPPDPLTGGTDKTAVAGVVSPAPAREEDDPPPLAPSTAAGARPRFPPAPDVRAAPVGAAARVGGRTLGAAALGAGSAGATTTRRREREREAEDGDDDRPRGGPASMLRLILAAVVIVAVLIFVATRLFAAGPANSPPARTTTNTNGQANNPSAPSPSSVTVAVLNGTQTSGLAGRVSTLLAGKGFAKGSVGNALSHHHTTTLVSYSAGNRAAALEVAKDLAPTTPRVGPVDAATASVAAANGAAPNVVVTIGSDYAQQ